MPFGTWFVPDMTVTDYRRAAWVSRKHVFLIEEFKKDPAFTDDAKQNVMPIAASTAPKEGIPISGATTDALRTADEQGRVVAREIIDRDDAPRWDRLEHFFMDREHKEEAKRVLGFGRVPFYVVLNEYGDIVQMGSKKHIDFDSLPGMVQSKKVARKRWNIAIKT